MEKELPKGWINTSLESLFYLKYGKGLAKKELFEEGFPVYGANGVIGRYKSYIYEESKVIISCRGAASGAIHKTTPNSYVTSNSIVLDEISKKLLDVDFVKYAMISVDKSDVITGTAQPQITVQLLKNLSFPLAPLPEQKRIVAKLDALFGHLDVLREKLDRIPELLKNFRQQVLTQAVTGKLTEEWRRQNSQNLLKVSGKLLESKYVAQRTDSLPEKWIWATVGQVATCVSGYAFKSKDFTPSGHQLIRMGNLYQDKLDLERNPVYLPEYYDQKVVKKYKANEGDILLSLTGTKYKRDYGYAILVPKSSETLLVNQRILAVKPVINNRYLLYLMRDNLFRDQFFSFETGGVNQGNVGSRAVEGIELPIPPTEEQDEITSKVDEMFTAADQIEAQYQSLKEKIDQLPQAILSKAFKGELVEQDERDEPAGVLLERIRQQRDSSKK